MAETTTTKPTRKRTVAKPDYKQLNVYQKLAIARRMFLEAGVKKSGMNRHSEYEYFELSDIVPAQTRIFEEVGLLELFSYKEPKVIPVSLGDHWEPHLTEAMATATVVNADRPEETIEFCLKWGEIEPIISKNTGKPVNHPIQNDGGEQTYMRRYLKMQVLDIVENDGTDQTSREDIERPAQEPKEQAPSASEGEMAATLTTTDEAPKRAPRKPPTQKEREKVADAITAADEPAGRFQVSQLKKALAKVKEAYGDSHPEVGQFIAALGTETQNLKSISKARCEQAIRELGEMKEKFDTEEVA